MSPKLHALARYRPRMLTLIVVVVIAGVLALSNLTPNGGWVGQTHFSHLSYGWPLIWHRYVSLDRRAIGWYYSAARLAGNLAMWLFLMAAPAGACEWLLRRYRPRLRWSLRTMLAAVGLLGLFLGWFAAAHHRAKLEDPFTPTRLYTPFGSLARVKRWGPKWLGLLGLDRYRRRVVAVDLIHGQPLLVRNAEHQEFLRRMAQLPELQHLTLSVDGVNPSMAAALNDMRKLRWLEIECSQDFDAEEPLPDPTLPALGKMYQIRAIELTDLLIDQQSLAGLSNLKSLAVHSNWRDYKETDCRKLLDAVGHLTQLEHLGLSHVTVCGESLSSLGGLTNLKSLSLDSVRVTGAPLLERLPACLEELALIDYVVDPKESCICSAGLESLIGLRHLKLLHLGRFNPRGNHRLAELTLDDGEELTVLKDDLGRFRRAMQALRQANPGLIIDGNGHTISRERSGIPSIPHDFDSEPACQPSWLPAIQWMTASELAEFEKAGGWSTFEGAVGPDARGHLITVSFAAVNKSD